jgi:ABC-type Na+ efflux pump permease subunit
VGWLAQYSWQARLIKWGWVLAVAIMEFWFRASAANWQTVLERHEQMAGLLLLTLAANSAITFHTERRTGAFELLLVSPLRPEQIAWGRLRGLVAQALPAGMLLAVCWTDYWPGRYFGDFDLLEPAVLETLLSLTTIVTLPAVGLFCSLRWQSPLIAWLATCAAGILPTLAGAWLIEHSSWRTQGPVAIAATMIMVLATQMLIASMCLRRVIRALARRDFAG